MSFVYALALALGVLVVAPYLAHRLRRRRADERDFAAAHLVPPAPPRARRRAKLEDRALFATRSLAVLALAVLGASPLVRCQRLALQRSSGASVAIAIVIDDSMSMRAKLGGGTRFDRAKEGARQLLASTREGDAVAVVLAGAPARVGLAATTDLGAARAAIDAVAESDRATDLDGAVTMARALVAELPQIDRRVVVLSDLADGRPDAPPLGEGSELPVWAPMPELREPVSDCGILSADRIGSRVRVKVACSHDATGAGREVALMGGDKVFAHAPAPASEKGDVLLDVPSNDPDAALAAVARLSGADAIASDDSAPVVIEAGPGTIAVVADAAEESAATGGAPVVEQALAALELDIAMRPIPALPDRAEDLSSFVGAIIDDPPGWTPEQRRAVRTFVEEGGVILLAIGPHAAAAQLGASLEPVITRAVSWAATSSTGVDAASASGALAESAGSLLDLASKNRANLAPEDASAFETLLKWSDGAPLLARRTMGRGEAWIVTLPFSLDASDLPLRPAFLALLDAWVAEAHARSVPRRTEVGAAWSFQSARTVVVDGPSGRVPVAREGAVARVVPTLIGAYTVTLEAQKELRVAAPVPREIDLRARAAPAAAAGREVGDSHAAIDASSTVALALLALVAIELGLRLRAKARAEAAA